MNRRFLQVLKFRVKKLEEFSWRVNHLFYSSILNCTFSVLKCIYLNSYVFGWIFVCTKVQFVCTKVQFDCTNVQFDCIGVQSKVQCTFYLRRRVFVGVTFSIPRSERTSAFGILQQETCLVIFAHWTSTIWSLNFLLKFLPKFPCQFKNMGHII